METMLIIYKKDVLNNKDIIDPTYYKFIKW